MLNTRRLAIGFTLLVLAGGSWWLTRHATPPAAAPAPKDQPDYVIENFVARTLDETGARKYVLSAERLTHYPADDTAHLLAPVLVQRLPNDVLVTTRADTGVMPGDGSEIVMQGNVRSQRSAGGKSAGGQLTAQRLRIELDR